MKKIILWIGLLYNSLLYAATPPVLKVGVDNFSPPFVVRGANNLFYGFDIAMMRNLCTQINRTCQFVPYPFSQLLAAVAAKEVDIGLGAVTITAARSTQVNFSMPYLTSRASFLGLKKNSTTSFTFESLRKKKIGVETGSVYPQVITELGIAEVVISNYDNEDNLIEALKSEEVDYALLEAPTAMFWQGEASDVFALFGAPFSYGMGLGIAVNKENIALLQAINIAIPVFLNSKNFALEYNRYLNYF